MNGYEMSPAGDDTMPSADMHYKPVMFGDILCYVPVEEDEPAPVG